MGDPKKLKKKFSGPRHPWNKERLDKEAIVRSTYGTINKKEIYKMNSLLTDFLSAAKKSASQRTNQDKIEKEQLLMRVKKLGLIGENQKVDNILNLELKDIMERRLQTIVMKRGLARTVKQARQMITHKHIVVGNKVIPSPSYLVTVDEENKIAYLSRSKFNDPEHPERNKDTKKEGFEKVKSMETKIQTEKEFVEETAKVEEKNQPIGVEE